METEQHRAAVLLLKRWRLVCESVVTEIATAPYNCSKTQMRTDLMCDATGFAVKIASSKSKKTKIYEAYYTENN